MRKGIEGTGEGKYEVNNPGGFLQFDGQVDLHSTPPLMKKNMWRFCFVI